MALSCLESYYKGTRTLERQLQETNLEHVQRECVCYSRNDDFVPSLIKYGLCVKE